MSGPPRAERERFSSGRWPSLAVYREPRLVAVLLMGFSSGLPLALTAATLSFWLAEIGVSLTTIGLFSLVGISYNFKFLWSPLIDRLPIPLLTRRLGRRRSWALALQVPLAAAILGLGLTDPRADPMTTAAAAVLVAFLSASQDIVIDAYRIELLRPEEQGAGAAATQWGYRFGMLAAGAGALYAAAFGGWALRLCADGGADAGRHRNGMADAGAGRGSGRSSRCPGQRPESVCGRGPAGRCLRRSSICIAAPATGLLVAILSFTILYKFGEALAGTMATPLYVSLGFAKVEVANIGKIYGLAADPCRARPGRCRRDTDRGVRRAPRLRRAADALEPDVCGPDLGRPRSCGASR